MELYRAVRGAQIKDRVLRDQALRAAKSACANTAEGAGRVLRADKARCYGIARAEAVEAVALCEIAAEGGDAQAGAVSLVVDRGNHLYALLTALVR